MREIQASEADNRLSELLCEVERGETVVITREGRPIARLVPEPRVDRLGTDVFEEIRRIRTGLPRITLEEILAWRHEGHHR